MFQIILNPKKNEDFALGNLMSKNIVCIGISMYLNCEMLRSKKLAWITEE